MSANGFLVEEAIAACNCARRTEKPEDIHLGDGETMCNAPLEGGGETGMAGCCSGIEWKFGVDCHLQLANKTRSTKVVELPCSLRLRVWIA